MKKPILLIAIALIITGIVAFFLDGKNEVSENTSVKVDKPASLEANGHTVNFISFENGYLRNKGRKEWVEEGEDLKMRFMFKENNRDESSVYLFDNSRNIRLKVDLNTKKIIQQKGNEPERVLYKINEALISPKAQQVKKVVYAYSKEASGSFANVPGTTVWLEDNPASQKAGTPKQLEEISRDEWSIYLKDQSGNEVKLDLYQKKIYHKAFGKTYLPLYEITKGI